MDGESELRTIYDLEAKLADVSLPFEEIVPVAVKDWLNVLARSHGTTREMLLLSALTSTSALIGKSSVQVFSTYEEGGNIFVVVVSPSGSGKTPACHLGCIDPIVEHIEPKMKKASLSMTRRVMACSITSLRAIPTLSSASTRPTHF